MRGCDQPPPNAIVGGLITVSLVKPTRDISDKERPQLQKRLQIRLNVQTLGTDDKRLIDRAHHRLDS